MEEKKLVPKLRFPGFTEPWEQRKLGEVIASLYNGQTPSRFDKANWEGDIPWLTSGELNRGVVNHSIEKITPQGRDDANLKIVPKGTVVIAITGLEAAGTRGNCAKLGFDTTLNQSCMAIYPKSEFLDPDFLFQWYIAVGEEYGIKYTQGTKQQSYNAELIKILPISVPRVTEQRKITRILDSFDDIITLHQRKLEHLKLKKKSLLQKLFPKEGEVYPELRFPGFTNPWEQRKFSELFEYERPDAYIVQSDLYCDEYNVPVLTANKAFILGYTNEECTYNKPSIIFDDFTLDRKYVDFPYMLKSSAIKILTAKENHNLRFLFERLNSTRFEVLGHARHYISVVQNTSTLCPTLDEENCISTILTKVDTLITLHQRKLEHLQLLKKALLQQLFV